MISIVICANYNQIISLIPNLLVSDAGCVKQGESSAANVH